ncbi:MAG: hypothetical protein WBS54_00415 [Acidobacteriota bacterium]
MSALQTIGLLLIVVGIIGLVYGGLTYTKTTHEAGPRAIAGAARLLTARLA